MKISKKELEKLVIEGLIKEIGPGIASTALRGNIGKMNDPRAKQLLRDSITSMFSKYIGRQFPFAIKAKENDPAAEYVLVEVVLRGNDKELVDFHFHNVEGVQDDAPYAANKKDIVFTYNIGEDKYDTHYLINTFTSRFLVKAANMLREMYHKAYPWKSEIEVDGEKVQDPSFKMKSRINKGDFRMFSYDSQAMLNEGEDTGNPYDLNKPENLEEFYKKVDEAWTIYCGQSPKDKGVANDNRVLLYNLLESGEFAKRMNQIWSLNGLLVNQNGSDYFTNNPEDMEAHLQKMGYSKGDYTLSPGAAGKDRFEQPYSDPETAMSLNEGILSNIKNKFMDKLSSLPALDSLADAIVKKMSPEDMSNFKSQVSGGVSESEGKKEFKAPAIDDVMSMVSDELNEMTLNESEDDEAWTNKWKEWEKENGIPSKEEIDVILDKVNNLSSFGPESKEKEEAKKQLNNIKTKIAERNYLQKQEREEMKTIPQKIAGIVRKAAGINLVSLAGAPLAAFVTASLGLGLLAFPIVAVAGLIASVIIYAVAKKIEGYEGGDMLGEMSEKESLKESIGQIFRDTLLGKGRDSRLIKKIEDLQGTKIDQRVDRVIYSNEELNNMSSDELVSLFTHMTHPRGRNW